MSTVHSIVSSDGVTDVNHIPVINTIDGGCENPSLGSAASCACLNRIDGKRGPYSLSKEVNMLSFFRIMINMTTTKVISVVNSLEKIPPPPPRNFSFP